MASLPGARLDISGASGSQGLLAPKDGWRAFFLPRGGYASLASTGNLITFDSASVASRFSLNDWVQVGLDQTTIRQVSSVGGNSIGVAGSPVTVSVNDRIFVFGKTQPTVSGGSATYTSPNTVIRQRDDDASTAYTNSMITTNANGLVQPFAVTAVYDVILQDGNRTNQGIIADLPIGTPGGISTTETIYVGGVSASGSVTVGQSATVSGTLHSARGPGLVRYADEFAAGSSTGGIQEAHDDLPAWGGIILMSGISFLALATVSISKPMVTLVGMGDSTILQRGWNPTYDGDNGALISVTGQSCMLKDFVLDANRAAFAGDGDALLIKGATNCTVVNIPTRNYKVYGINFQNAPGGLVTRCRISNGLRAGIYGNNSATGGSGQATGLMAVSNVVDCTNAITNTKSCIALASVVAGRKVDNAQILGNRLIVGTGFGVEVQQAGGDRPKGVLVGQNTIIGGTDTTDSGGISMANCDDCAVTGNILRANGVSWAAGIEIVGCTRVSAVSNTLDHGRTVTRAMSIDRSNQCEIAQNTINGTAQAGQGIIIIPQTGNDSCDDNTVSDNKIFLTAGLSASGIYAVGGAAGTVTLDRLVAHHNTIKGDGTAGQYGFRLGSGTSANQRFNSFCHNTLHSLDRGFSLDNVGTLRNTKIQDNVYSSVATPITLNTLQQNITGATDTLLRVLSDRIDVIGSTSFTLTSAPTLADGADGDEVTVTNVDTVDTITIQDQGTLASSNLRLGATTRALGPRDSIKLRYDAQVGDWIEQWFSNVI